MHMTKFRCKVTKRPDKISLLSDKKAMRKPEVQSNKQLQEAATNLVLQQHQVESSAGSAKNNQFSFLHQCVISGSLRKTLASLPFEAVKFQQKQNFSLSCSFLLRCHTFMKFTFGPTTGNYQRVHTGLYNKN